MSESKKRRLSMLDSLANAAPAPPTSGQTTRALRAARDAVDGHSLWELDPNSIDTGARIDDRLDMNDLIDLRDAIEANGQTVPILVRRDPQNKDRYLLVYGRRRLEAIRMSDKVEKVRALVATMDDNSAIRAQVSENMARRDLTYIERALFAQQLIEQGFGTQTEVAEVLTVTRSSVSMALTILEMVTPDLARTIGSAQGIGRPRWEALGKAIAESGMDTGQLAEIAENTHDRVDVQLSLGETPDEPDSTVAAFNAVFDTVMDRVPTPKRKEGAKQPAARPRSLSGSASLKRTGKGVRVEVPTGAFADWLEREADRIFSELHDRWRNGG